MTAQNPHRLPRHVLPKHYAIELEPDLKGGSFTGQVVIDLEVITETDTIVLNAADLEIEDVQNKVNEILYSKRQAGIKNIILKNIQSIKKTFKNNSVFFYFFDELILRIFDKLGLNIRLESQNLSHKSYNIASNNFYDNSKNL